MAEDNFFYDSINDVMEETIEHLEKMCNKNDSEKNSILGFDCSDLEKGYLIILASRPHIGKTAYVLSLIKQLAVDKNIPCGLILPGIIDYTTLGQRLISIVSGVSI